MVIPWFLAPPGAVQPAWEGGSAPQKGWAFGVLEQPRGSRGCPCQPRVCCLLCTVAKLWYMLNVLKTQNILLGQVLLKNKNKGNRLQ